jgi:hypothetical protein
MIAGNYNFAEFLFENSKGKYHYAKIPGTRFFLFKSTKEEGAYGVGWLQNLYTRTAEGYAKTAKEKYVFSELVTISPTQVIVHSPLQHATASPFASSSIVGITGISIQKTRGRTKKGLEVCFVLDNSKATVGYEKLVYNKDTKSFNATKYEELKVDDIKAKEFNALLAKARKILKPRIRLRAFDYLDMATLANFDTTKQWYHQPPVDEKLSKHIAQLFVAALQQVDESDYRTCEKLLKVLLIARRCKQRNGESYHQMISSKMTVCEYFEEYLPHTINAVRHAARLSMGIDEYVTTTYDKQ